MVDFLELLIPVFLIILVVGLLWFLLKFALRQTVKIVSCGFLVILVVGLIFLALVYLEIPAF